MSDAVEQFLVDRVKNGIELAFHTSYNSRHFGADYGERYHHDPLYRIETDMKVAKGLYEEFGQNGMGKSAPEPALGVGIQTLDFMNAAMGGRMIFHKEATVETPDKPLSKIKTFNDIEALDDIHWENSLLLGDAFSQVELMKKAYPELPIVEVQGVWQDGPEGGNSFLTMHTPYTTSFRLFGQTILELMLLEEELAEAIFEWLMRQYRSLWDTICKKMNWKGTKIHFGDCAATMLSPDIYEALCLPLYKKIMEDFDSCVMHSCGKSSHLLELFAQVLKVRQLQLGHGTDLHLARELFRDSSIVAYYEPARLISDSPAVIEKELWGMAEQLEDNFVIRCGDADPDTPLENIYTFLFNSLS